MKFSTARLPFGFFLRSCVMCHRLNPNIPLLGPSADWNKCQRVSVGWARFPLPVPSRVSEALGEGVPVDLQLGDLTGQREMEVRRCRNRISQQHPGHPGPQGTRGPRPWQTRFLEVAQVLFGAWTACGVQQRAPVTAHYSVIEFLQ